MYNRKTKYPLQEHWESKLNIKYETEFEYYKKFCGYRYKYKMFHKYPNLYSSSEDITYKNWRHHVLRTTEMLSLEELKEYSRFLNQRSRDIKISISSFGSLLIPCIICLIGGGVISPVFNVLMEVSTKLNIFSLTFNAIILTTILLMIFLCPFFMSLHIFKRLIITNKNDLIHQNFYHDIKEIIDKKIVEMEHISISDFLQSQDTQRIHTYRH